MERLTYKNYIEEYEVNFEKSSDKNWSIAESDTHIKVTGEPIDKLGELEDVLEEFELTSAEDLRNHLNFKDNMAIWEGKLELKNKIADLEQELAELKQNAIVPKYKVGQEIWDKYLMAWKIKRVETHQFDRGNGNAAIIEIYRLGHDGNDDYSCFILPDDNDIIFATKEEAEHKLSEIGGKDE